MPLEGNDADMDGRLFGECRAGLRHIYTPETIPGFSEHETGAVEQRCAQGESDECGGEKVGHKHGLWRGTWADCDLPLQFFLNVSVMMRLMASICSSFVMRCSPFISSREGPSKMASPPWTMRKMPA